MFEFFHSSLLWCNLTPVSTVWQAVPRSLFWAPMSNGLNELPEVRFEFPFILNGKLTRTIMARNQMLVHRWGPWTRISALFRRQTQAEFSFVCSAGYVAQAIAILATKNKFWHRMTENRSRASLWFSWRRATPQENCPTLTSVYLVSSRVV